MQACCKGGCIYQSAKEASARSVDVSLNGSTILASDVACSAEVLHYFPVPTAGLACIRFVGQKDLCSCLKRFPQQEPLEAVVGERQQ